MQKFILGFIEAAKISWGENSCQDISRFEDFNLTIEVEQKTGETYRITSKVRSSYRVTASNDTFQPDEELEDYETDYFDWSVSEGYSKLNSYVFDMLDTAFNIGVDTNN